uniref:Uncharacterized protein n=1 Tax=Solanum lycopersicum TaxID=4081 RepID=K4CTC8_SOLLC
MQLFQTDSYVSWAICLIKVSIQTSVLSRKANAILCGSGGRQLDLVKGFAARVVGQRTYRNACGPIYDVSSADVCQAGHIDCLGSSLANEKSISKALKYLFDRCLYLCEEFATDRSCLVSPSFPRCLVTHRSI